MSWKCICESINEDENLKCPKCGKEKPSYLGIKLGLKEKEKLTNDLKAKWLLMIASSHLNSSIENLNDMLELLLKKEQEGKSEKLENLIYCKRNTAREYCDKCISIAEMSEKMDDKVILEVDETEYDHKKIKSESYRILGQINFNTDNFTKAIEYCEKSHNLAPNQDALYLIARSIPKLPIEGVGGVFASPSKRESAEKIKRNQEIELLMNVIRFDPYSELGIECGNRLIESYGLKDFNI